MFSSTSKLDYNNLLHGTVEQVGVTLVEDLQPCTGCSVRRGQRKAIASTTTSRATGKLQRVVVDLSAKKSVASTGASHHNGIIGDGNILYTRLFFLEIKSDAAEKFEWMYLILSFREKYISP